MRIILTHEQADFDAVASLLGAYRVDEAAVPVMPRRLNRNVRAFITLYGAELPFLDPRDLSGDPIEAVTLVDTQSLTSVKGMGPQTKVRVIDHHPVREELPADWEITTADIGATTTLFVEALREQNGRLTTAEATLLLLGIYEDTGSLTYTRTTSRDLLAAAFLLEHGASLEIANDFLNHPLSPDQQALYDRLREDMQTYHIHGHTIIVACGEAREVDEELATVAHKMRELLDPDALFLLVAVRGGVQLIARSTSDHIDVAQVADHFGGGGHERAAAGLIKDRDVHSVCAELAELLPQYVQPATTVAQIMSHRPQLLTPDTPVGEAARRMQRYGYEGYPVVKDGKVVGLLTRRAVDRAISHKLKLNAASLMDAGSVNVHPGDSIEHLQKMMTDTGWGQIPVVHPESGQIIGIVTRTDLLKTLTRGLELPQHKNLANRLETALPPARLALLQAISQLAHEQHAALYIVGGFVRDLMLDRPSLDFDLVVEGDAIELAEGLASKYGGRITSHARFGTAKWHIGAVRENLVQLLRRESGRTAMDGGQVEMKPIQPAPADMQAGDLPETLDLITARTEFYTHPTALPTVERGSIKLDLHRRDFTINTLALRLDGHHYGELHDYWGGLEDLRQGLVRVLHSLSFVDDPTRMLRAVRFEQRFGFQIEDRTQELLREARPLLARVSGERIRHELDHILEEEKVCAVLARLEALDLLAAIHGELKWDDWLCEQFRALQSTAIGPEWDLEISSVSGQTLEQALAYILWLIRLPAARARAVIERLKIPSGQAEAVKAARRLWRDLPGLTSALPSLIVSRLKDAPPLALYAVYLARDDQAVRGILKEYVTRWKHITARIDGHILRARGLPPGPVYRKILGALRDARLDGKIGTLEEEQALLETLLSELGTEVED